MDTAHRRTPVMVRLNDTTMTGVAPDTDIRGHRVVDSDGEEIGHVVNLLVDHDEEQVRFLEVGAGGVLGLGETKFLIPLEAVLRVEEDTVHVGHSLARVLAAPRYEPEVVPEPDWGALYGYYGLSPFWSPTIMVPQMAQE